MQLCQYPGCENEALSNETQNHLCEVHSTEFTLFNQWVFTLTEGRGLPRKIALALFLLDTNEHVLLKDLAQLLQRSVKTIGDYKGQGKITLCDHNMVSVTEAVRVCDLRHNWVMVRSVARQEGIGESLLIDRVQDGTILIKHCLNLGSELCIPNALVNELIMMNRYVGQQVHEAGRAKRRINGRTKLRKDEMTPEQVANLLEVNYATVPCWIKKGWLNAIEKQPGHFVIRKSALDAFIALVLSGKLMIKEKVRGKVEEIYRAKPRFDKKLKLIRSKIFSAIGESFVDEADDLFCLFHREGCWSNQLGRHLAPFYGGSISCALAAGTISGVQIGHNWWIPFAEMARTISLVKNWVPLRSIRSKRACYDTLLKYAQSEEKWFGETRYNLRGLLCISKAAAKDIDTACIRARESTLQIQINALSTQWPKDQLVAAG